MSRIVNHTGATAPFDYTIVTSPAYAFVFEPHTLKITLGSGYNETQEVTIEANGIPLKRNCIARVCTFDLSVIFESYFADKTFELNYAANAADPFYQSSFNVVVTALTETQNVPFSLRWGAYQFDEVKSDADYTFPIWSEYPLVINSDKEHDTSIIAGSVDNDGTISAVDTIAITDSTATFTHEVKLSGTKVQTITYVPQTCPVGHYMQWVDEHGMIRHFMFYANREKQIAKEIKSGETIPYYPTSIEDTTFGRGKVLEKSKQRTFGCFQSVEEAIYPIVESIASSPIVKYWTNSKWIEVKVKDMTIEPLKRGYVDIEFMVELPTDYIQRR
jgi:hypothetical protein